MIQEGEGHWPNSSKNLQKARNLWVLRTPQNNKEEGARAMKLVTSLLAVSVPLGYRRRSYVVEFAVLKMFIAPSPKSSDNSL
jgi:hypothetical protein